MTMCYCPIRRTMVRATPEEKVRQALIQDMIQRLNYPVENILVEKSLSQLPHLLHYKKLPLRRADIVVLAKNIHREYPLFPLLLIECKAVALNEAVFRQVVGYNQFVAARFVAIANQFSSYLGYYFPENKDFIFREGLLSYEELLTYTQETSKVSFSAGLKAPAI